MAGKADTQLLGQGPGIYHGGYKPASQAVTCLISGRC